MSIGLLTSCFLLVDLEGSVNGISLRMVGHC